MKMQPTTEGHKDKTLNVYWIINCYKQLLTDNGGHKTNL